MKQLAVLGFLLGILGGCTYLVHYDQTGLHVFPYYDVLTPTQEIQWGCVGKTLTSLNLRGGPGLEQPILKVVPPGQILPFYEFRKVGDIRWGRSDEGWLAWSRGADWYIEAQNDCRVVRGW